MGLARRVVVVMGFVVVAFGCGSRTSLEGYSNESTSIGGASSVPTAGSSGLPPSTAGAGAGGASAGAPSSPSAGAANACKEVSLNVPWPVLDVCQPDYTGGQFSEESRALRCAFDRQLYSPDYGAFVACCPKDRPYACASSTPYFCAATIAEARAACGEDCVKCSPW